MFAQPLMKLRICSKNVFPMFRSPSCCCAGHDRARTVQARCYDRHKKGLELLLDRQLSHVVAAVGCGRDGRQGGAHAKCQNGDAESCFHFCTLGCAANCRSRLIFHAVNNPSFYCGIPTFLSPPSKIRRPSNFRWNLRFMFVFKRLPANWSWAPCPSTEFI